MFRRLKYGVACVALLASGAAVAAEPIVVIESDLPEAQSELLRDVLGDVEAPARSVAQARRRVVSAAKSARSVMRSQGYYDAKIVAEVIETKAEAREINAENEPLVDDAEIRRPPQAILRIIGGEQFTYGTLNISFEDGEPDLKKPLISEIVIKTGEPAEAARVIATELRLINYLQTKGYPEAKALTRETIVDHAMKRMNVTFRIATGRKTRFGTIKKTGTAKLAEGWPNMIAPFETGDEFNIAKMNRLAARVTATGVFDGAVATLADEVTENADGTVTRDVILDVEQGDVNTISGEVGYSTSDGTGVEVTYERRNFIGYAQTLELRGTAKTNEISAGVAYNIPYAWRDDRELDFDAEVARLDTEAFEGERVKGSLLGTQKFSRKFRVGLGLGLEASQFEQNGEDVRAYLVEGLGRAVFDNRDNVLNPETGFNIEGSIVPTYNFGDEAGSFTTLRLGGSTYKRVSDKFILAGRVGTGTILSKDFATVPQNRRFYAGGGGSVRGFEYQTISPRRNFTALNDEGELVEDFERIGGRTLIEGSAEIRYKGEGPIGYVGFVDAGTVSREQASGLDDVRFGAGMGVRYYTSFAPLRADIAIPINPRSGDADFQLYISIGQAF
ncbi:autotransporter assembly complex protein TamA [Litorimonas sp. WD9-15]|uniref:autotransporter assembly complex protein TamA n=1 Tax=Litorimonas sp. WD9-15 TaxID=3418716 RepID=UPI003D063E67